MSAISFKENRDEITGLTHDGAWHDVDLSSKISGDAIGVIIEIASTSITPYQFDVRCKGSSDDFYGNTNLDIDLAGYSIRIIKVDASKYIQIKSENAALTYFVVGEIGSGAILKTYVVDKSTATTSSWEDVDITSDLEDGDAGDVEAAIVMFINIAGDAKAQGIRKNGSTEDIHPTIAKAWNTCFIVGVDDNDIFEQYIGDTAVDCYLVGYIKKSQGLTMFTNPVYKSSLTANSWTDLDITSDTSATANGVILRIRSNGADGGYTRKNGSTNSETNREIYNVIHQFIGLDDSQILEYYLTDNSYGLYIFGYTSEEAPAGVVGMLFGTAP